MTKLENKADTKLLVESIEVLGNIGGNEITKIRREVTNATNSIATVAAKQNDFWTDIITDSTIDPAEKTLLKKEWETIIVEYPVIIADTTTAGIPTNSSEYTEYVGAKNTLYNLLFTNLKLFDSMTTSTKVVARESFTTSWTSYYEKRQSLQAAIVKGYYLAVKDYADSLAGQLQDQIQQLQDGALLDYSVTMDKLDSGLAGKIESVFNVVYPNGFDALSALENIPTNLSEAIGSLREELYADLTMEVINESISTKIRAQNMKKGLISYIESSVNNEEARIDAIVANIQDDITAALSLQAGDTARIAAIVSGGGAEGYLSLSITLPVMISQNTRNAMLASFVDKVAGETAIAACYYEITAGSGEYAIKSSATQTQLNTLRTALRTAGLLGSQFAVSADDILMSGKVAISNVTDNNGLTIINGGKIRTDLLAANMLKVGDTIQSDNYATGSAGFILRSSDGFFECVNGKFNGEIDSGPLKLTLSPPAILSFNFASSEDILSIINCFIENGIQAGTYNINGTLGTITVSLLSFTKIATASSSTDVVSYTYIKDQIEDFNNHYYYYTYKKYTKTTTSYSLSLTLGTTVLTGSGTKYSYELTETKTKRILNGTTSGQVYTDYEICTTLINSNLSVAFNTNSGTFRLTTLPTGYSESYPSGTVYIDGNILKIKT